MATTKGSVYTKTTMANNVEGAFVLSSHQVSTWSETSDGGVYVKGSTGTINITKSGYYPLAVVGTNITGTNNNCLTFYRARLSAKASGSATVQFGLQRDANVAHSNSKWYVDILWVKE